MSKAEVNRISPFFCQASKVCTNTSLRDREERRALWGKEPEKVEASSHEKANTVRSLLPDSWLYRKSPPQVFGWKTPKTHRKQYAEDRKTRHGMMTSSCIERRVLKGHFTPKIKIHIFHVPCIAIYPHRFFFPVTFWVLEISVFSPV